MIACYFIVDHLLAMGFQWLYELILLHVDRPQKKRKKKKEIERHKEKAYFLHDGGGIG